MNEDMGLVEQAAALRRMISQLARKLNVTASDHELTPTEASVLAAVAAHAPIGIPGLVASEHINPTMLSRVINKLVSLRLIERHQDPLEHRASVFEATESGLQMAGMIRAQRAQIVLDGIVKLSETDRSALWNAIPALRALNDSID